MPGCQHKAGTKEDVVINIFIVPHLPISHPCYQIPTVIPYGLYKLSRRLYKKKGGGKNGLGNILNGSNSSFCNHSMHRLSQENIRANWWSINMCKSTRYHSTISRKHGLWRNRLDNIWMDSNPLYLKRDKF